MSDLPKYAQPEHFIIENRKWPTKVITESPSWVSVDLRDGNQALPNPLNSEEKLVYFKMLCDIGFKEIEVAFPSASAEDFEFTRSLITDNHIPDDVTIMGLTQCRESLIRKTFDALKGAKKAILHSYIATSDLHMNRVFKLSEDETIKIAVESTKLIRELADANAETDFRYQFSPEEFEDTDINFAIKICEAVYEAWGKATPESQLILNLPGTVERRPANQYADMVEIFCNNYKYMDSTIISVHTHNDQGMGIAASELSVLAGATRVEGTLFGYGERTGNIDLITMACNLEGRGVKTGLDFSNLPEIASTYERLTNMKVYYRQPYSGELVFTAFSGSHQDAIRKGMSMRKDGADRFNMEWKVPYLHFDPNDLGRDYAGIVRINSQSGKGGAAYILEQEYGYEFPKAMLPEIGELVQHLTDREGREVTSHEVHNEFYNEFVKPQGSKYELIGFWPNPDKNDPSKVHGELKVLVDEKEVSVIGEGNGPVNAFGVALKGIIGDIFTLDDYHENTTDQGSNAKGIAYISVKDKNGKIFWGVSDDTNTSQAAIKAFFTAVNRMLISNM